MKKISRPPIAQARNSEGKDEGERLAKRLAHQLPCSRREAEQYIEGGWVRVDGVVVEEPQFRVQQQAITLDPDASLLGQTAVTLLLNKPPRLLDATLDNKPGDARSLLVTGTHWPRDVSDHRLLKRHLQHQKGLVPLETGASGLLVFTQDWRIERKLTEDMASMEHELIADVQGEVADEALQHIARALNNERQPLPPTKVSIGSRSPERSKLRFAIKGAHPGLVAHLCALAELQLLALRRIRIGRVALGDLPPGQWRFLAKFERF